MSLRRASVVCLFALLAVLGGVARPVLAQPASPTELKAAYLLNFLRYSQWPPAAARSDAPFSVVVLGSRRFATALEKLLAQPAHGSGRGVEVVHLPSGTPREQVLLEIRAAHAVFVEAAVWPDARGLLDQIAGEPVLTVGDGPDFARNGGMLGLVQRGPRIVFDANPQAIRRSGLQVSARVLKLARIVGPEAPS